MRTSTRRLTSTRSAAAAVAAAVAVVPLGLALSSPAQAADSPAVLDKTLTIFRFGADFGIPTGCQLLTAVGGNIAGENGFGEQASPVIQQINQGCDEFAKTAVDFIDQGKQAGQALAFINTFANPAIKQFSAAVGSFGADNTELVAPFGPTIAGLGGTINFFQGSNPVE